LCRYVAGGKNHLLDFASLIPTHFLKMRAPAAVAAAAEAAAAAAAAAAPAEDPLIAAMRAANPYYEEDVQYYEAYHRRLAEAALAEEAAEVERAENRKRLFRCAATGDVDTLEDVIWAGVDSDAPNPVDGSKTALHYAAAAGQRAAAQVLIEHGGGAVTSCI
jgi:hypothetical protein